jgi:hypothetical protein
LTGSPQGDDGQLSQENLDEMKMSRHGRVVKKPKRLDL